MRHFFSPIRPERPGAEQVSEQIVPQVEALGISGQEPLHACGQIASGRSDQQVKIIGHQA